MQKGEDTRWDDLIGRSGAIDGACITGIRVRAARLPGAPEDVVLCPPESSDARLVSMRQGGRAPRTIQAERVFLARTLSSDARTAVAMLVRAVVSNWTAMRGHRAVHDEHERRAVALAETHLSACGIRYDDDILGAQRQISRNQIRPPVAHDGPHDVVRKAIEQIAAQIGGRHVIIMGDGPMAATD